MIKPPNSKGISYDAEIIILFKSGSTQHDTRFAAMQAAMNDELFLTDLRETMEDFSYTDAEEPPA